MAEVLAEVRAGRFADELRQEEASGYPRLEKARDEARATPIEQTFRRLRGPKADSRSARACRRAGRRCWPARDRRAAACDARSATPGSLAAAAQLLFLRGAAGEIDAVLGRHGAPPCCRRTLNRFARKVPFSRRTFSLARSIASRDSPRFGGIAPLADPDPLVGLEILVVGEEMLDLLEDDRRQVLPLADIRIIREGRVDRHADQLLVAAMFVLED